MHELRTFGSGPEEYAPQVLFFVHIPKCAGSSFRQVLKRWFGPDALTFDSHDGAALAKRVESLPRTPRAIAGHFSFGIHQAISCRPIHVSLVRDPVDRLVSLYKHARAVKDHFLHGAAASQGLEAFYEHALRKPRSRGQILAIQCHFLSRARTFEEARAVIDRDFAVLAPIERFEDFVADCARIVGRAPPATVPIRNAGSSDPALDAARLAIAERVRAENPEDLQLYHHVRERFESGSREWALEAQDRGRAGLSRSM